MLKTTLFTGYYSVFSAIKTLHEIALFKFTIDIDNDVKALPTAGVSLTLNVRRPTYTDHLRRPVFCRC